MKLYANLGGNSNVVGYEYGEDYIKIQFGSGKPYVYSYGSAGNDKVEQMKMLADKGVGLNSFVKRYANKLYER